jgi:Nitrile hydratase beta subunit
MERFRKNDRVKVRLNNPDLLNRRTPSYVRGKSGIVAACYGEVVDLEFDHDHRVSWGPLYTVEFAWSDLFLSEIDRDSKICLDIHESWLELIR